MEIQLFSALFPISAPSAFVNAFGQRKSPLLFTESVPYFRKSFLMLSRSSVRLCTGSSTSSVSTSSSAFSLSFSSLHFLRQRIRIKQVRIPATISKRRIQVPIHTLLLLIAFHKRTVFLSLFYHISPCTQSVISYFISFHTKRVLLRSTPLFLKSFRLHQYIRFPPQVLLFLPQRLRERFRYFCILSYPYRQESAYR